MTRKATAAIVGPGNIGTDLLFKLLRSDVIEPRWMIGVDPTSDGLELARERGVEASHEGVDWLLKQDELPELIFEATSAYVHREYAPRYAEAGIRAIDLTPAAVGPAVIPPVNGEEHLAAENVNMITCGGQATIPMVHAVSRVTPVPYAEIVASVSSASAGPGTRANIDEFTRTTAAGVETIGGAERGKAIIILNPAEPPMIMRDTIFCAVAPDVDRDAISESVVRMAQQVQEYVPGYRLLQDAQFDDASPATNGKTKVSIFVEIEGAGRLPAAVRREPRHHDRRGRTSRRVDREGDAQMTVTELTDVHTLPRTWSQTDPESDLDLRLTDSSLRDGSHHKRHQFVARRGARHRGRPRRRRHPGDRGDPRRRPRRIVVQLRLLRDARAGPDQAGRGNGDQRARSPS